MLVRDLIKELQQKGYWLKREGKKHHIYTNGLQDIAIPRGSRVKDMTATRIRTEAKRNKNKVGASNDTME